MPTYTYKCTSCDHQFDAFHAMSADPLTHCPADGCSGTVEKLLGAGAGMLWKGSGFYETDYKRKNSGCAGGDCASCPAQ